MPMLAQCLSDEYDFLTPSKAIQVAAVHCSMCGLPVKLLGRRLFLKCLAVVLVSFGDECRGILHEENGLRDFSHGA